MSFYYIRSFQIIQDNLKLESLVSRWFLMRSLLTPFSGPVSYSRDIWSSAASFSLGHLCKFRPSLYLIASCRRRLGCSRLNSTQDWSICRLSTFVKASIFQYGHLPSNSLAIGQIQAAQSWKLSQISFLEIFVAGMRILNGCSTVFLFLFSLEYFTLIWYFFLADVSWTQKQRLCQFLRCHFERPGTSIWAILWEETSKYLAICVCLIYLLIWLR